MAGVFDENEMKDFDINKLEDYTGSQLNDYFNDFSLKKESLYKRFGDNKGTPKKVRVKYKEYDNSLNLIEEARDRREETTFTPTDNSNGKTITIGELETTFTPTVNSDGKTVTIEKLGDPIEAPSSSFIKSFTRKVTIDKKENIRRILGMDHQFRVRDGKSSKELIRNSTVVFNKNGDKVIGLSYKGVRIYVSDEFGKSYKVTTNKRNQYTLKEFNTAVEKATEEHNKFEEEKQNYPLVDKEPKTVDIHGLTPKENSELRGVLTPNKSIDPTTRSEFLKAQANHFQETIDKTLKIKGKNSLEDFELSEREIGLEEARDRTLNQLEIEEIRESQEEDISRLIRFKEWAKKNIAALTGLVISIAGIITTIIVSARSVIAKGAQGLSKFAKAVYKTFKDIAKTLGPILGPVISAIGSLLSILLKYAAEGVSWLAKNLWALVIAITYLIYSRYQKKK